MIQYKQKNLFKCYDKKYNSESGRRTQVVALYVMLKPLSWVTCKPRSEESGKASQELVWQKEKISGRGGNVGPWTKNLVVMIKQQQGVEGK